MIITGTDGFIGGQLMRQAVSDGRMVSPMPEPVDCLFNSEDGVFVHLGADAGIPQSLRDPLTTFDRNIRSTGVYLQRAVESNLRYFLFASSAAAAVYPAPNPYAASKQAGEAMCLAYMSSFGLASLCMRFSNVYGPGSDDKTSVVAAMCRDALTTGSITIYGDGTTERDFIHVSDVVNTILYLADRSAEEPIIGIVNVCTGYRSTINDLAEIIRFETGARLEHTRARPGDVAPAIMERSDLLPKPFCGLVEGIIGTLHYFRGKLVESKCEHEYECTYEGMESETYVCKHCGDRYKLYEDEMR